MGLREIGSRMPPGFRFHPSDEELVCYYLRTKVASQSSQQLIISPPPPATTMVEVDLHAREPWELPEAAKLSDNEWYFFSFRDRKYATGSRTNRASKLGYWKATGKDKQVIIQAPAAAAGSVEEEGGGMVIGMRKTLVFHLGRAPNGRKSGWVMHEFRLLTPTPPKDWVLCRVFHKGKGEAEQGMHRSSNDSNPAAGGGPPRALCSPPPAAADNHLERRRRQLLLPIGSPSTINDQLLDDDDQLIIMRQVATPESQMLLLPPYDSTSFEFSGLPRASTSAGEMGFEFSAFMPELETEMVLLPGGNCGISNGGVYS